MCEWATHRDAIRRTVWLTFPFPLPSFYTPLLSTQATPPPASLCPLILCPAKFRGRARPNEVSSPCATLTRGGMSQRCGTHSATHLLCAVGTRGTKARVSEEWSRPGESRKSARRTEQDKGRMRCTVHTPRMIRGLLRYGLCAWMGAVVWGICQCQGDRRRRGMAGRPG